MNTKVKNALFCALFPEEFNRVVNCTFAKDVWDALEITRKGTSQVKAAYIQMLTTKLENIKICLKNHLQNSIPSYKILPMLLLVSEKFFLRIWN